MTDSNEELEFKLKVLFEQKKKLQKQIMDLDSDIIGIKEELRRRSNA